MRIYLDNAATTPVSAEVIDAMLPYWQQSWGNPSSIHAEGRTARAAIENARKIVAKGLNCSIGELFFTSCGTESNNMALKCAVRDLGVKRIISSATEHHCVLHTLEYLEKQEGVIVEYVTLDSFGAPDLQDLEQRLSAAPDTKTLVSLMHGNNEIGAMLDLQRCAILCQTYKALFHTDTVQTIGHFEFDLQKTPISFLSGSAHKFHGPKGIGFIYINSDNLVQPFIHGGAQERNMRAGTENVVNIVGLAKAFELAYAQLEERRHHIANLQAYMRQRLIDTFGDLVRFNGQEAGKGLYHVLSVSLPENPKTELLMFNLDIAGISASGGSACASGVEHSHVLAAIKHPDDRRAVRFSFSHYNTQEEVDTVIEKLARFL